MRIFIEAPIGYSSGLAEIDVLSEHTIGEIKAQVCNAFNINPATVALMYGGMVLNDNMTIGQYGIPENARLALMPYDIIGGIDVKRLVEEREYVKNQFPMVAARNDPPTIYEGMIKCEEGPVVELAGKGVWPFTEYVKFHLFKMDLPSEYPLKPPLVTWLTDIDHPNIVPRVPGAVCVSTLGESWNPNLRLSAVVNSLIFLLTDPNPYSVYRDERCLKAAEICRKYGFPKRRNDIDRKNISYVNIPQQESAQTGIEDKQRFRIRKRK
jgi:hypothetical protein